MFCPMPSITVGLEALGADQVLALQEEYLREQIEWKEIPFSDNQPCIDLISQKPYGILRILDDQSCFPQVRGCGVSKDGSTGWSPCPG